MHNVWEELFSSEGALWKFEASDSAILALRIFQNHNFKKVLIPGFGYGRNALLFLQNGFEVTGIEISPSAIRLARENGITCSVHLGSVTEMPYDAVKYDGIFCYALLHLLNKNERKKFLRSCLDQLTPDGIMIFVVVSRRHTSYGSGKYLSRGRFELRKGVKVFFYDEDDVDREFAGIPQVSCSDIAEPVKFMEGMDPLPMKMVVCSRAGNRKSDVK
jgi:SAM-dependent methyltransferase